MPTNIDLSWVPSGVDSKNVQETVWQGARKIWMSVLLEYREGTGKNNSHLTDHDASFVVETLQGLGPTLFREPEGWPTMLEEFSSWLDKHVSGPFFFVL